MYAFDFYPLLAIQIVAFGIVSQGMELLFP